MRVVLDTNVLVSAFVSPNGEARKVLNLWLNKRYDLVTSEIQIEELRRVSRYPRVKKKINSAQMGSIINAIRQKALIIENLPELDISPDPDDNFILAAGVAGKANYIVSGDRQDVLTLGSIQGIPILSVSVFVKLFK